VIYDLSFDTKFSNEAFCTHKDKPVIYDLSFDTKFSNEDFVRTITNFLI
jgi:hypothetical protein